MPAASRSTTPSASRARWKLALLVVGGYVLVSFSVGNAYPFSIFDMYSHVTQNGSRIAALKDGRIVEVDHYVDWSCDDNLDGNRCGSDGVIATSEPVDAELLGFIRAHSASSAGAHSARSAGAHSGTATNATPVDLIRRTWFFSSGPTRVADCVLARCRAVPR